MPFYVLPPAEKIETVAEAKKLIAHLADKRLLAFDTETSGLVRHKDRALILSLSDGKGRWAIWPSVIPYFQELLENPSVRLVGHNANFDQWMLLNVGIDLDRLCPRSHARVYDTMVMHALLDDAAPHDLKYLARNYLGIDMVAFKAIYGKQLKNRPLTEVLLDPANEEVTVNYSALDAFATYKLFLVLQRKLDKTLLRPSDPGDYVPSTVYPPYDTMWQYYTDTEVMYTKVLWHMERKGIMLDVDALLSRAPELESEIAQIERWFCHKLRRHDVNIKSNPQMCRLFFNVLGYEPLSFTDGGLPQLNKTSLKTWAKQGCEYATKLLRYRDLTKQLDTYVLGLLDHMAADGRIHTRFNQTGARCMPAGELVLTNRGYIPVETVRVDDYVLTHAGRPRRVVECSVHAPEPMYHVTLSNGLTLRTTGNHAYRTGEGWTRADQLVLGQDVTVHADAEVWRTIPDWEDFEVSSWGRVRNRRTAHILGQVAKGQWGHRKVQLYRNGAQTRADGDRQDFAVHRLVLLAFEGPSNQEVRHLNGIAWDNTLGNLRYGSAHENRQDARKHGTLSQRRAGRTKISAEDVADIRSAAGHPHGPSKSAKLTQEKADSMRQQAAAGTPTRELAQLYGVSPTAAWNIITNKTWVRRGGALSRPVADVAAEYGLSTRYVREIQQGRKWQPEAHVEGIRATFSTAKVTAIARHSPEVSYGLTVEEDHSHVTAGIVTHNTGRLSSAEPNLQNQPPYIRDAYVAKPGFKLKARDQQQLEMRILAHVSGDPSLCDAIRTGKDVHSSTGATMYNVSYEAIMAVKHKDDLGETLTKEEKELLSYRKNAKTLNFGIMYGMGPGKLSKALGTSIEEAKSIIKKYFAAVPRVKEYFDRVIQEARRNGYSSTIMGRRRQLPGIWSSFSGDVARAERQVKNAPIQGFASEILKVAMNRIFTDPMLMSLGVDMLIQVHDELVFELPEQYEHDADVDERIQYHMVRAIVETLGYDLNVPLDTSGKSGYTWADCK